ncbi:MAG: Ig-like domain-containing protein, partial [Gammaproteobacteria bacterium]|nr:Ig-like domain-containing protein [Gammaproteobacteria bacterium]
MDDAAVADLVAPVVETMSPVDGATDVGINAQVHMRFSEAINPLTFNPALEDTLLQSVSFSSDNTKLTYIPHEPFAASSAIQLSAPAVTDNAGNALTPYRVNFTTASGVDLTKPGVESVTPRYGDTVAVNAVIQIGFNEPITPDSINASTIFIYDTVENSKIAVSYTQSSDYKTVFVVPDAALAVGRQYRLEVDYVRDMAYNAASNNTVYNNFTASFEADSTGPVLVASSIVDGYTDVPTNAVLELQFDEPLSGIDLNGLNLLQGGSVVPLQSRTLSDGNRRVRLYVSSPLEPDTAYVLRVAD